MKREISHPRIIQLKMKSEMKESIKNKFVCVSKQN